MTYLRHFLIVIALFVASSNYSQEFAGYRQPASPKAIPKLVMNEFNANYPDALTKSWYVTHLVYWQNDCSSNWYYDWYGPRNVTIYTFEKPTYFEVEFVDNPGELSRAIYNLYGYWFETRTQINSLPKSIIESLQSSEYKGWKISSFKERIESPSWPNDIYRFQVSKGLKTRIIRMEINGTIIQAKYIN